MIGKYQDKLEWMNQHRRELAEFFGSHVLAGRGFNPIKSLEDLQEFHGSFDGFRLKGDIESLVDSILFAKSAAGRKYLPRLKEDGTGLAELTAKSVVPVCRTFLDSMEPLFGSRQFKALINGARLSEELKARDPSDASVSGFLTGWARYTICKKLLTSDLSEFYSATSSFAKEYAKRAISKQISQKQAKQQELEDFLRSYKKYGARMNPRKREIAEIFANQVAKRRGQELAAAESVDRESLMNHLVSVRDYLQKLTQLDETSDAKALIYTILYALNLWDAQELRDQIRVTALSEEHVISACRELNNYLGSFIYETESFKLLNTDGRIDEQLTSVATPQEVAELLTGWAHYHTCRTLTTASPKNIEYLYSITKSVPLKEMQDIVDEVHRSPRVGLETFVRSYRLSRKNMDPHALEVAEKFARGVNKNRRYKHKLEIDPVFQRNQKAQLETLKRYLQSFIEFDREDDAEALLDSIRLADPSVSQRDLRCRRDLARLTTQLVVPSCKLFVEWLGMSIFERNDSKALEVGGGLRIELDRNGARDDVKEFVFGWAHYQACKLLVTADEAKLDQLFEHSFEPTCLVGRKLRSDLKNKLPRDASEEDRYRTDLELAMAVINNLSMGSTSS